MSLPKLLIVEDDPGLCSQYRWAFPACQTFFAADRATALAVAQKEKPPVAIMDLGLPPDPDGVSEGFATLEALAQQHPEMKVIVATSHGDRSYALRAVANGAYDFCEKPVEIEILRMAVDRALRLHALEQENRRLAERSGGDGIKQLITANEGMRKVSRIVERLAPMNVTVLLLGESGTGKEVLARALHDLGPRARQPFIAINCGAIPENLLESELFGHERGAFTGAVKQTIGKIESANNGTLFLDEIGDLPHSLQVKLLRFLNDQRIERVGGRTQIQVDVRVISATNQLLEEQVTAGTFRSDLFYRINPVTVRIPPLRERGGNSVLLARYFLDRFNKELSRNLRGFTEGALAVIASHPWPGNVRELENRIKRAAVMCDGQMIDVADLELESADAVPQDLDLRAARMKAERGVLEQALARSGGRLIVAAKLLGISRPTLYGLLELHNLNPDPARTRDAEEGDSGSALQGIET